MMPVILDAKTARRLLDMNTPLVAFDTETTGLDAANDYVIEIAAARFDRNGFIGDGFSEMIKPPVHIPPIVTQINGITDDDVRDAPPAAEVLPRFLEYIKGKVLVAHNAGFDLAFVGQELARAGLPPLAGRACDTLTMARRIWHELGKGGYKLDTLAMKCGIDKGQSHRALDDARTCAMLFLHMANMVS